MKYTRGSFITVPSREALRGLHPTAQAIYMWLCSYANETENCYPSRATLAKDARCSDRTVDEMLELLIEKGLIQKKGRKEGDRQLSNLYTVMIVGTSEGGSPHPSRTFAPPAKEVRTNSNQLTQTTEVSAREDAPRREYVDTEGIERIRSKPKYPHALEVFGWFPRPQKSWESMKSIQEREYAEYLYARGEEAVKKALRYCEAHKDEEHFYQITKPSDLEKKWEDIRAYAKRNS